MGSRLDSSARMLSSSGAVVSVGSMGDSIVRAAPLAARSMTEFGVQSLFPFAAADENKGMRPTGLDPETRSSR